MRQLPLLLAVALALPVRAAVVESGAASALPTLPASAVGAAPGLSFSPSLSAPTLLAPSFLAAPPASPAIALPSKPHEQLLLPGALESMFAQLDAAYPLPAVSPTSAVRAKIRAQLLSAARELQEPEGELLKAVALESDRALARIQLRLDAHEIDPSLSVRLSGADPEIASATHVRIAVYPVAADPFQWGHLLIALRAVGDLGVDKIVFVLAGDDPRKPTMTPVERRHPMGRDVLAVFEPFFAYSPIAVGTTLDGETNIFRILALNSERRVDAWYMVGDDHYRLVDKKGNPDTLPKLERNYAAAMGHSPTLHALKVAFIKRKHPAEEVPTTLEVRFLDHVGFDASSTQVRGGRHTLMPFAAYDAARRSPSLYGLAPAPEDPE